MSFLFAVAGAIKRPAGITLSAPFSDITDAPLGGPTAGNTVTLSMASGKTITYTVEPAGTLRRKLNAGAFTIVTTGSTVTVANGDTLQHDYATGGGETGVVTLKVGGATVDTFVCTGT